MDDLAMHIMMAEGNRWHTFFSVDGDRQETAFDTQEWLPVRLLRIAASVDIAGRAT